MAMPKPLTPAELDAAVAQMRKDHIKTFGDMGPHPDETIRTCHCGTCQEAFEAALRTVEQLLENECGLWVLTVAAHMDFLGRMAVSRMISSRMSLTMQEALVFDANHESILEKTQLINSHPENVERAFRTIDAAVAKMG